MLIKTHVCRADALSNLLGDDSETVNFEAKDATGKTKGVGLRSLALISSGHHLHCQLPACLQVHWPAYAHQPISRCMEY